MPKLRRNHMAKKMVLALLFAALVGGGVFAQEKTANVKRNWVSGEVSIVGAGARYEFMINEKLSVGVNAYWTSLFFIFNDLGVNAVARYYPWGKMFYAGLGLGLGIHTGVEPFKKDGKDMGDVGLITRTGFDIVPEVGWKIDVGQPGGFFLNPLVQAALTLGTPEAVISVSGDTKGDFGLSFGVRPAFGMGWAF
jgi:hypothetical protein